MENALKHWDPDRQAEYITEEFSVGVLELFNVPQSPIIPQPYIFENFVVGADCRIDNRPELATELNITDIDLHSDIEFIILAYKKWGQKCVNHLCGDFAFVIYDKVNQEVFAARDHFGIKTLYYTIINNNLFFSSEIKGLLAIPNFEPTVNEKYVVSEFSALQHTKKETLYNEISALEPGYTLHFKNQKLSTSMYWELGMNKLSIPATVKEQEAEFNRLVKQSVATKLRSYRKIASEASGGLDSTGLQCLAMEILGKGAEYYSFGYGKAEKNKDNPDVKDDTHVVREMCEKYGITENLRIITDKDLVVEEVFKLHDEVLDEYDSNGVPTVSSSFLKYAKEKNVGTIISGWAGDQMVTNTCGGFTEALGYKREYAKMWKDIRHRYGVVKTIPRFIVYFFKTINSKKFLNQNLKKHHQILNNGFLQAHIIEKYKLKSLPNFRYNLKSCTDIQSYQKINFTHNGIQGRAFQHEHVGKHFNTEYRFPMMDVRLIEYIHNLPFSTLAPNGKTRYLFKKLVAPIVPKEVIKIHKSRVFTTPFILEYYEDNAAKILAKLEEVIKETPTSFFNISNLNVEKEKEYLTLYFYIQKLKNRKIQ
jgi:asparagine synthase (glutamine-hydrolysing)